TATVLPTPPGATAAALEGIACTGSTACVAVGSATVAAGTVPLMEDERGAAWTPMVDATSPGNVLEAVSCPGTGTCVAVGGSPSAGLAETLAHGTWSAERTLPIARALASVWCDPGSADLCTTFGAGPVVESLSAGSWSAVAVPSPSGTSITGTCGQLGSCVAFEGLTGDPGGVAVLTEGPSGWSSAALPGPPDATLSQISCTLSVCAGVGTYYDDAGQQHSYFEVLVHGRWQEQADPLPTSYLAAPSISCNGGTCVAVSSSSAAVTTDGTTWATTSLPTPSGMTSIPVMAGISCSGPGACVAVGNPFGAGNGQLVETLAAGSWTAQLLPLPAGSSSANLEGVSCTAPTACLAVGAGGAGGIESLVATLSGTGWKESVLPAAPGATYGSFDAVSCTATSACVAVGSWYPSYGGVGDPLVATLSAAGWSQQPQTLAGGDAGGGYRQVACPTSGTCDAVEWVVTPAAETYQLSTLSGGSWSAVAIPAPAGATTAVPQGVSCTDATWCSVAGYDQGPWSRSMPAAATLPMLATTGAPEPRFTSAPSVTATPGVPLDFTVTTHSVLADTLSERGVLPTGFSFTDLGNGTASITGTATASQAGNYVLAVQADDGVAPVRRQDVTLTVS
ncbi:MAG: hypothetical protein ACYC0E_03905, partial [Acidimicrobiales bacterium]